MEFLFGLKDIVPHNESFPGMGLAKLGPPLLIKTMLKSLPDKIRRFQTGCFAELADVLLPQQTPCKQKAMMALCGECSLWQELHFLRPLAEDLLGWSWLGTGLHIHYIHYILLPPCADLQE